MADIAPAHRIASRAIDEDHEIFPSAEEASRERGTLTGTICAGTFFIADVDEEPGSGARRPDGGSN
jgi:hypothetical protein